MGSGGVGWCLYGRTRIAESESDPLSTNSSSSTSSVSALEEKDVYCEDESTAEEWNNSRPENHLQTRVKRVEAPKRLSIVIKTPLNRIVAVGTC